ncbi:MAG: hypothetical protein ACR2KG_03170 [Nocardioidaceae bacterium]
MTVQPTIVVGVGWVVAVALVAAAVALWTRRRPAGWGRELEWRFVRAIETCTATLGRPLTAAVVIAAGAAGTVAVCWPLGKLAGWSAAAVDRPVYAFFDHHQVGWWDSINNTVTHMGNGTQTEVVAGAAAIVFAVLWRRGRWWAPLVVLVAAMVVERFAGQLLAVVVDRGHPPTTLGTWPSGGCARLVLVAGLVIFLYRRWRGLGAGNDAAWWWVALAVLGAIEAYTRVVLLKHWLTDTLGGLVFGTLLLLVMIAAFTVLDWRRGGSAGRLESPAPRAVV